MSRHLEEGTQPSINLEPWLQVNFYGSLYCRFLFILIKVGETIRSELKYVFCDVNTLESFKFSVCNILTV